MITLQDLAPAFLFIHHYDFQQVSAEYTPQVFGNAVIILKGKDFSLRFERDRGEVFVDIGTDETGWQKLEHVFEFLDCPLLVQKPDVVMLAEFLKLKWDDVINLFNDSGKFLQFREFTKQKTSTFLNTIFGNNG